VVPVAESCAVRPEPPTIIGCLSCGWVHGHPWRCAARSSRQSTNGVLLRRRVFFDSKLFAALNGTWNEGSPLAGATVYGNSNTDPAHLSARVIQLAIEKNLTVELAYWMVGLPPRL